MSSLAEIQSYADIRRLVSPAAFVSCMEFVAWHNQQRKTAPLAIWQAVVVAYACDARTIDRMLYGSIHQFLHERDQVEPVALDACRAATAALLGFLFPHDED